MTTSPYAGSLSAVETDHTTTAVAALPPGETLWPQVGRDIHWRWWLTAVAVSVAVSAAHVWQSHGEYLPGLDESWMLQAGWRLYHGQGMTSNLHAAHTDLSAPVYRHLYHWTPGQSWLYAGLLSLTGGSAADALMAMTVLKVFVGAAGLLGWLALGAHTLPVAPLWPPLWLVIYGWCLTGIYFAGGEQAAPGHLVFWAAMPAVIGGLLIGVNPQKSQRQRLASLLVCGLAAAVAVLFRYHAGYVIIAAAGVALVGWPGGVWSIRRVVAAIVVAGPPTAMMAAIALYNAAHAAPTSWVSVLNDQWQLSNLAYRQPLTVWLAFGFGLEDVVVKIKPSVGRDEGWLMGPWYGVIAAAGFAAGRAWWRAPSGGAACRLVVIVVVFTLALVGMLGAISYRGSPEPGWMPIGERRLYSELLPAVGLAWLIVLAEWLRRGPSLSGWVLLAVMAVGSVVPHVRHMAKACRAAVSATTEAKARRQNLAVWAAVEQRIVTARQTHPQAAVAVFDVDTGVVGPLRMTDGVRCEQFFAPGHLRTAGSTKPLVAIVVVRDDQGSWTRQVAESYALFFDATVVETLPDAPGVRLHQGYLEPWPAGSRHVP